ncbi:hypothetical protein [Streptomyces sp. NPDC020607]|uniref:hypothetical protein n=1 Tax=Streptomyces sp. NPDC020607 TaxID=3365082 RepID=UPI0037B31BE2
MSVQPAAPDPVDVALRVLLDQPTYAAQTALTMAAVLDLTPGEPMTYLDCARVANLAADAILGRLPAVVREESLARLHPALPPIGAVTHGEYALHLRNVAKGL